MANTATTPPNFEEVAANLLKNLAHYRSGCIGESSDIETLKKALEDAYLVGSKMIE